MAEHEIYLGTCLQFHFIVNAHWLFLTTDTHMYYIHMYIVHAYTVNMKRLVIIQTSYLNSFMELASATRCILVSKAFWKETHFASLAISLLASQ